MRRFVVECRRAFDSPVEVKYVTGVADESEAVDVIFDEGFDCVISVFPF